MIAHNVETLHVTSGQGFYYGYATGHDIAGACTSKPTYFTN
ncbi:hypothetical protein [Dulcicalothrix desertica]|nr:hypothetical protein [Dulcicalothrix desertica]